MYKNNKVGVVVPAYNEEEFIGKVIETIPSFVDKIIVVDDRSEDNTVRAVKKIVESLKDKLVMIQHEENNGVGASIVTGYKKALKEGLDIVVVMAGDGQMNPDDMGKLLNPIVDSDMDYVKGNRLLTEDVRKIMPGIRYFGNSLLTILTKIASGYWHVMDPQCGYTAISSRILRIIPVDRIYPRYGFPSDLLVVLNVYNARVKDVPVKPIYGEEKSGIKLHSYIPAVSFLLAKRFFWRLKEKYLMRDFHPLIFFYMMGLTLLPLGILLGLFLIYVKYIAHGIITTPSVVLCAILTITGLQSLFFGMLFDIEYNRT